MKFRILLTLMCVHFSACSADEPAEVPVELNDAKPVAGTNVKAEQREGSDVGGHLRLGDEIFEFDQAICVKSLKYTAIASNTQYRDQYPTITIKTVDKESEFVKSSASVVFHTDDRQEQWRFLSGTVKRRGNSYSANGFIEGNTMVTLPNGNLKPEPMGDEHVRAFVMTIKCRV